MTRCEKFSKFWNFKQIKLVFFIVIIVNLNLINVISSQYIQNSNFHQRSNFVQHHGPHHEIYPEVRQEMVPNDSLEYNSAPLVGAQQAMPMPMQMQMEMPMEMQIQLQQQQINPMSQPIMMMEPGEMKPKKPMGLFGAISEVSNSFTTMSLPNFFQALSRGRIFDRGGGLMPYAFLFLAAYAIDSVLKKPVTDKKDEKPPVDFNKIVPYNFFEMPPGRRRRRRRRKMMTTTAAMAPAPTTLRPDLNQFEVKTPLGSISVATNAHKDHKLLKLLGKRQGHYERPMPRPRPMTNSMNPDDGASSESVEN